MCRQVSLRELRVALVDYCQDQLEDGRKQADDLLAEFEEIPPHALEHGTRAAALASLGDHGAAEIHQALSANMARAAVHV